MRYVISGITTIVFLALVSLLAYRLLNMPIEHTEELKEEPIQIFNKDQLTFTDPECEHANAQVKLAKESKQSCQTDNDCQLLYSDCKYLAFSQENYSILDEYIPKRIRSCGTETIASCPMTRPAEAQCIKSQCKAVQIIHLDHEIQSTLSHIKKAAHN